MSPLMYQGPCFALRISLPFTLRPSFHQDLILYPLVWLNVWGVSVVWNLTLGGFHCFNCINAIKLSAKLSLPILCYDIQHSHTLILVALLWTKTRKASSQIHLLHKHFVTCQGSPLTKGWRWGVSLNMEIASLRDQFMAWVFGIMGTDLFRKN